MFFEETNTDAYNLIMRQCKYYGYRQNIQRGSFANEATYRLQSPPIQVRITEPLNFIYMPKTVTIGMVTEYYNSYIVNQDVAPNESYTYGERICEQLPIVLEMLRVTPHTNQAVISVSRPEDIHLIDPPCLREIVFNVFDEKMHISSFWRSNDIGEAFLLNQGGLALLLKDVARNSGFDTGYHYYHATGAHVYQGDGRDRRLLK